MTLKIPREIDPHLLNDLYFSVYTHRELFKLSPESNINHKLSQEYFQCSNFKSNIKFLFALLKQYRKNAHLFENEETILPLSSFIEDFSLDTSINFFSSNISNKTVYNLFKAFNISIENFLTELNKDDAFSYLTTTLLSSPLIDNFLNTANNKEKAYFSKLVDEIIPFIIQIDEFYFEHKILSRNEIFAHSTPCELTELKSNCNHFLSIYCGINEYNDPDYAYDDFSVNDLDNFLSSFFSLINLLKSKT